MTLFDRVSPPALGHRLLWEALVDISPMIELGEGPHGTRRMIPIVGGEFRGGPGLEAFRGTVMAGGADRQLIRRDGGKELDALYEMQVEDGTILTVHNRVIIDETDPATRAPLSRIEVTAPEGPWGWLSRRMIVGTLQPVRPEREGVLIRGWEVQLL
jgi:hypothetical protein